MGFIDFGIQIVNNEWRAVQCNFEGLMNYSPRFTRFCPLSGGGSTGYETAGKLGFYWF